jgi:2-oxoglutarate dehydrogenase E2 component (dihydrolipoamide succinyltransferase)
MATEIKVPDMGESVIEASVVNWIKQEGDSVSAGEAVVELETDKVTLEVSAQQAGILQKIVHPVGETVSVGDVLAYLGEAGEKAPEKPQPTLSQASAKPEAPAAPPAAAAPSSSTPGNGDHPGPRVTPIAQRMAQDMGIDLAQLTPTGSGGRITKEDVQSFVEKAVVAQPSRVATPAAQSAPEAPALVQPAAAPSRLQAEVQSLPMQRTATGNRGEERVRFSRRRQTIARRLVEAQHTAAMLTTFNEIDMSAVMELRKRRRDGFKERYGVDLGYMSFFVKTSIGALKAFPEVNAELQGDELVLKHYYDIGIAIGAEEGLVVPVVRDADRMNFAGIEKAIRAFSDKVKSGTLAIEDLRGGTFTITNGGVYGSLMSTPILNPPQVAILGMHAIKERAVVVNGEIVIRPMMYVALSYDHRVVDGSVAVRFLVRIKELVEDPEALLFG